VTSVPVPRALRAATIFVAGTVFAACGAQPRATAPDPTIASSASPALTAPTTLDRVDDAAQVTTTAERVDDALRITWIGGSDLELDGRSLPDAVAALDPVVGERRLHVVADTKIAPLPSEIAVRVERAAARNADGLVVILNPSWLSWDGHTECSGITDPHDFYGCVLTPRAGTDVDALRSDVRVLIDTVVETGVPTYMYVMPHSAESTANAALAPRLEAAEAVFAGLDPDVARVEYIGHMISRDLPPLREGVEFNDMVHPGEAGIPVLAAFFRDEFVRFFGSAAAA
jgi:hypothetical protein